MIYQVFNDGAIFPLKIDFVIYYIIMRSSDANIQELKKKPLEELKAISSVQAIEIWNSLKNVN